MYLSSRGGHKMQTVGFIQVTEYDFLCGLSELPFATGFQLSHPILTTLKESSKTNLFS